MLNIPKMADYAEILTEKQIKNSVVKNFGKCFKSMREESYSKLEKMLNHFMLFQQHLLKLKNMLN